MRQHALSFLLNTLTASTVAGLLWLAYLWTTTPDGLHPFISGLLVGCTLVLRITINLETDDEHNSVS